MNARLDTMKKSAIALDSIASIASEYEVLHFDEIPVLYSGVNAIGIRMIGSVADWDLKKKLLWYFHIPVTDDDYASFRQSSVSYRDLVLRSSTVFIIRDSQQIGLRRISAASGTEIPEEFLPGKESFCPAPTRAKEER